MKRVNVQRTRWCSSCGKEKYRKDFSEGGAAKDGKQGWCKECFREYQAARQRALETPSG